MANEQHLDLLKQGVETWNQWRKEHSDVEPDLNRAYLTGANLRQANLLEVDLSEAKLSGADLFEATLFRADLSGANLSEANLFGAAFTAANLFGANLTRANLTRTTLSEANLSGADLSGADLSEATIVRTQFAKAILTDCRIYGISAWDVHLEGATQSNLVITPPNQPTITVDNLKVAQFIYLLLNNQEIREVIDTITSKVVLILGRFTPERKVVLDAVRDELRKRNYSPVVFDFEKPASQDLTETVSTLAHLARFIIVDLTDPSSAPYEVASIVPQCVVPVQPLLSLQPLIVAGKEVERHEFAMFEDLRRRYRWVLPTVRYQDVANLLVSINEQIIEPAEQKGKELAQQK